MCIQKRICHRFAACKRWQEWQQGKPQDMQTQPDITAEQDARALDWQDRGHLLTNLSNVLDSLEESTAPNAMHAKVAVIEKIIDIVTNMEA